ncbi:phage portal protein [Paraclostridium benzoelyticum]|nr:phage portal protein [Paraclostridium benzoelyticum]
MKLFDRFRNQNSTESINTNPTLEQLQEFFGVTTILDISNSKLSSATYYACMQIRCNALAKLPLKLMQELENGSSKKAVGENLYKLLKYRPNPFMTPHDFKWATEFQRLDCGDAFWVIDTDPTEHYIRALYLLDSTRVRIMVDDTQATENGDISGEQKLYYLYNDPKKGQLIYTKDQIVHFKNFSMNGIKGTSIKKYLSDIINNEQYATNVLKDKYQNGLQDPIIVEYVGDLNDAKQQKIRKKFANLGGTKNAGKVVPIPTDFKVTQLETKLVNSQFFEIQGLTTRHIANAFGVKGFQLNDMEKSTYNNIEQQNKAFYSDILQNVLTTYEEEMYYKLLFDYQKQKGYYLTFNVDSILRSDLKSRTDAHRTAVVTGWKTIAEVRAQENLPYIEGTDKLIIGNGASIFLDELGNQYSKGGEKGEEG